MSTRQIDRPLEADALAEIEGAVRGKLKAYDLSDSFIERCLEDAVQKGLVEYLRALDKGEVVENRNGFVVRAAFVRAIDELRREARQADGSVVDAIIDSGGSSEPATDEVAIEYLQAEELREAVGQLSPEEQKVLSLHYFEEKTAEASAETLFCSERTYRRRLKQALRKLGRMLDAPVPEPGSELAIEIGVVTWVALRGANVVLSQSHLEHLVRLGEGLVGRTGGENSERVIVLASSGPAKVLGGCAAAAAACLLAVGGAELAGVGAGGPDHPDQSNRAPIQRAQPSPEPRVVTAPAVPTPPAPTSSSPQPAAGSGSRTSSSASAAKRNERKANQEVESQGAGSLLPEESSPEPAPEPAPTESSSPPPSESTPNGVVGSQGDAGLVQP